MRRLFLVFVLLTLLFGCQNIDDASKRNQHWIWWVDAKTGKGSWVPTGDRKPEGKTGLYTGFYFNGKISQKGKLINGEHVDTTFFYDVKGKLQEYKLIKKAQLDENAKDTIEYFYHDGLIKMVSPDGSVHAIGIIKNHFYGDKWTSYFKNGNPERIKDLKQGTGWITTYYDNGKVEDSEYVEGKDRYLIKHFYPLGQIEEAFEFRNHNYNGPVKQYYLNGRLSGICTMINGRLNGRQVSWFENGHLKGVSHRKNGVFDGPDTVFYENGRINVIGFMSNGKVDGEYKQFDKSGRLIADEIVKDGVIIENKLLEQTFK